MGRIFSTLLAGIGTFGALAFAGSYAEAGPYHYPGVRGGGHYGGAHGYYGGAHGYYGGARGYYGGARGYYGGARVGVYVGAPLLWGPWGYNPPYYPGYYAPMVIQEQPVVYVEQQPAVAGQPVAPPAPQAQPQQPYWYFCQDTQSYYPHVQNCATPWQRVIPHAPR